MLDWFHRIDVKKNTKNAVVGSDMALSRLGRDAKPLNPYAIDGAATQPATDTILDMILDGVLVMDDAGMVTRCNPACGRMFGYEPDEIIGRGVERLIPALHRDHPGLRLESGGRRGGQGSMTQGRYGTTGRRADGEAFPLDLSLSQGEQDGGVVFIGLLRDVTEARRADDPREQLIRRLSASNEEQRRFAQVAAHDLSAPLRMVTAFCGLLSKDYGERFDARGREYLSLMVSATGRMRDLLDDLVAFERPHHARARWFEADEACNGALQALGQAIAESGAEVTRSTLPKLHGDPIRFSRLMQNLIGNGLKYVAPGTAPQVHVSAAPDGAFWRFSVADKGVGISPRHRARIFQPFQRLHADAPYEGSGLGLAICRRIVEDFGGRIWVRSTPGRGSTFCFTVRKPGKEGDDGPTGD